MILDEDMGSLRIRVFNAIENAILNGEYKDGESLSELRISKEMGVSRTPVREALMQLELEGLVRNIPNKGAVVVGVFDDSSEVITGALRARVKYYKNIFIDKFFLFFSF